MPDPCACLCIVRMVPGSLGPNHNLVEELERILLEICCPSLIASLPKFLLRFLLNLRPCVWSELIEPGYLWLFTCERLKAKWPH